MATQQEFEQHVKGFSQSEHLNNHELILNFALGLAGETGEFIDVLKKHLFHGDELDRTKLIKEAGDICFYWVGLRQKIKAQIYLKQSGVSSDRSVRSNLLRLNSISGAISQAVDDYYIGDFGPYYKDRLIQSLKEYSQMLGLVLLSYSLSYEEIFDANIAKLRERHGGTKFNREAQRISKGKE